ncbi:hypothetical protein N657DRAFT_651310 [Parathielavia appendiculata]|uniref:Uncharacterized protein n=1 Tax=Parathielavia appendiculata TaxID=2587402 RepID=A0AAN6TQN7_9PEZI|nr:hypothetical protein N657DRAFT_651310 [Parathielavia appendiculata]
MRCTRHVLEVLIAPSLASVCRICANFVLSRPGFLRARTCITPLPLLLFPSLALNLLRKTNRSLLLVGFPPTHSRDWQLFSGPAAVGIEVVGLSTDVGLSWRTRAGYCVPEAVNRCWLAKHPKLGRIKALSNLIQLLDME